MKTKMPFYAAVVAVTALSATAASGYCRSLPPQVGLSSPVEGVLSRSSDAPSEFGHHELKTYDLSAHQALSRVILLVRENYVEPDRIRPYEMFLAALDSIEKTIPEIMVDDHLAPAQVQVSVGQNQATFELGGLDQLWEVTMALRDIFRFLEAHVSDATKKRDIEYAAVNGILGTLDPHSVLMRPENFDEMKLSTKGEFGGLGIVISIRDAALTIIAPIEGTPAGRAGLKAKDKIVKIGEESTINMGLDEAVQRLRGAPDSNIVIGVSRTGWTEPKSVTLTRAIIKIESVSSQLLPDDIGYVRIKSFQGNTSDDLDAHLLALKKKNANRALRGLVLDLRNNPGGLLDQAISVSDRFLESGPIVITVGEGNKKREVKSARMGPDESSYPIAVLVNGGSASASEIVSGALKNQGRAFVLGQQSFGKGSVQVLYDFKDRSALKLTIAQYLTPGDISIQSTGIVPDIAIVPAMLDKNSLHLFVDDDSPREKDLEKHLEKRGGGDLTSSAIRIIEVVPKSEEPDGIKPIDDEALYGDKFQFDFETRLAHDILREAKSIKRPQILKDAMPLLERRSSEQDAKVADAFGTLGVNWAQGSAASNPNVSLGLELVGNHNQRLLAGERVVLRGHVQNLGAQPLHRTYGVSQSDNPLFKNLEFAFGEVAPGETRSWDVNLKLPSDMPVRADGIALRLGDAGGISQKRSAQLVIEIGEQRKPQLQMGWRLRDANGNQDGVAQVGEAVTLEVRVKNAGPAAAEDVTVVVKNTMGEALFLEQGRSQLGRIPAGQTKTATLAFTLKKPADVIRMRLAAWDIKSSVGLSVGLTLPVAPDRKIRPEAHPLMLAPGRETPLFSGASEQSPVLGYARGKPLYGDGVCGNFWRADVPDLGEVFVKRQDVQAAGARVRREKKAPQIRPVQLLGAPVIDLDLSHLVASGTTMKLSGRVVHTQPLKDMLIFVNDKKVFYQSLAGTPLTKGRYIHKIDMPLPLEPGGNNVAVIVRQDDETIGRRFFGALSLAPKKEPHVPEETAAVPHD